VPTGAACVAAPCAWAGATWLAMGWAKCAWWGGYGLGVTGRTGGGGYDVIMGGGGYDVTMGGPLMTDAIRPWRWTGGGRDRGVGGRGDGDGTGSVVTARALFFDSLSLAAAPRFLDAADGTLLDSERPRVTAVSAGALEGRAGLVARALVLKGQRAGTLTRRGLVMDFRMR
jgi:hypothetical protein